MMEETNRSTGGRPKDTFVDPHLIPMVDFDLVDVGKKCKYCNHEFSNKTSVTRIKAHLGGVLGYGVAPCKMVPPAVKEAAENAMPSSSTGSRPSRMVQVGASIPNIPHTSTILQLHHVHIDSLVESSNSPTSIPDQAKKEKKRKFFDKRPIGKPLPLETIFQGLTFKEKVEKICESLEDDSVSRIGVYGMGGSGKTMIMKFIHNRLLEGYFMLCSHVIWVTVSQDHTISKLQHHLASVFNVELSRDEDELAWAASLYEEMRKMRYALILDDVWDNVNLEQVGIPKPSQDNGCKLILTTRSLDVCRRMQCRPIFLDLLSEEEAWELFVETLDVDSEKLTIQGIMKEVVKECACLSLAIVTVAESMRGIIDVREWRNALDSLTNRTYGFTNMKDQVMEKLKFSYYRLSEQLQSCLVNYALYPKDRVIKNTELIKLLIMEGTIGCNASLKSAYDHGQTILNKLENASLLIRDSFGDFVIHDLIRDMCLDIMGDRFLVKCHSESPPDLSEYKDVVEKVSLISSRFEEIPMDMMPYCPKLSTLLLSENEHLTRILDCFFMGLPELKILNLSGTSIQELPSSITNLVSLNALVLQRCTKLRGLPCLTPLKALKQLDLYDSGIKDIPNGLEILVSLTYLDLDKTAIETPLSLILGNLVKLQYLKLPAKAKIIMKDVKELKNLEVFKVVFANWEDFSEYISLMLNSRRRPSRYHIKAEFNCVGDSSASLSYKISRDKEEGRIRAELRLRGNHKSRGENWLSYEVIGQIPSPEIIQDSYIEGFLNRLHEGEDKEEELKGLFDATFLLAFANLVTLDVCNSNFTKDLILASSLIIESSSSSKVLSCFQNLQVLQIQDCTSLESIVSTTNMIENEESNNSISFPNLRMLTLENLPNLRSICDGILICPSIEHIEVDHCPKLKRLPLQPPMPDNNIESGQLSPPLSSLKKIKGESEWWESLEWDHAHTKILLQPYFEPLPWWW